MKHIVSYSGGIGSFMAAVRVIEKHGLDDVLLVFTDTKTEDTDLYRFLVESAGHLEGKRKTQKFKDLIEFARSIPEIEENRDKRLDMLAKLEKLVNNYYEHFLWLSEGRDIWQLFEDKRMIGSNMMGFCTYHLKREVFDKWLKKHYNPADCIIYLGIDWSEYHRFERAKERNKPYVYEAPMTEEPYLNKEEMIGYLNDIGIEIPVLYKKGFPHNNCGGFCVKTGMANFINLLENYPERYKFHEEREKKLGKEIAEMNRKGYTILSRIVDGERVPLTLEELRIEHEKKPTQMKLFEIDYNDFGGCGCFVDD